MEMLTLVLLLAIAVLVSAVIDQIVPRVSLPLIQVSMGVIISLFAKGNINIELEPDLFLVLFIAPLLYLEAKDADKALLWRNKKPILSLAIGLVVATTLIIGFTLNAFIPSLPLAAAFALGAALGPTDAVAVTSLSKQVSIPERQWGILKGELLLNDASGIVSFQFAIAAATTGAFSLFNAGVDFVIEFVGGLIVGAALGYIANLILRKVRDIGIESTTFHVLYEICIPFIVYLLSDAMHVSGIIAVVVAGLVNVIAPRTVSPSIAHMNIVSTNVWHVISFTLNGIVFVLLGTQIPASMMYSWEDTSIDNVSLIFFIFLTTFVLLSVRFIWCLVMEYIHVRKVDGRKFLRSDVRKPLLLTLCGAKGTITLSILFTIPIFVSTTGARFPDRQLILFIGCGVILLTLLIATFIVPLVAPKKARKQTEVEARQNYYECLIDILRNVIEELTSQQTRGNRRATKAIIRAYQDRIENTKQEIDEDVGPNTELRLQTLEWEEERTVELMDEGIVNHDIGFEYLSRIERMKNLTKHSTGRFSWRHIPGMIRVFFARLRLEFTNLFPELQVADRVEQFKQLQIETSVYVLQILHDMITDNDIPTEDASQLILQYENTITALKSEQRRSVTSSIGSEDAVDDIKRIAYQIELEQIQKMYESDRINRQEARNMRENVYLMQMDLEDRF